MVRLLTLSLTIAALGCSSSGDDAPAASRPTHCTQDDANGTYLLHYDERSGNCGDIPDGLVRLDGSDDPNCTADAPAEYSQNDCKLETANTCVDPATGETVAEVAVITETAAGGAVFSGTISYVLRDSGGAAICSSTYAITFTRQ